MKRGLNKTQLIGNVGREDAQLGSLPSGTPVLNFSLAVNDYYKDKQSGEDRQTTEWFKIAIFGERAKSLAPYITSGKPLYLEGKVGVNGWNGEDGSARADLTLKVKELLFLDGSKQTEDLGGAVDGEGVAFGGADDSLFPSKE